MGTSLVIGASRGIGLELVRQSLAAGERVLATARSAEGVAVLRSLGATALRLDVAQPASVSGLSWQLDGEKIDTAWYVAGLGHEAKAASPPTQPDFDHLFHTNVLGAMQTIPQVAPLVEAAQGRMVFLSSVMAHIGQANASPHRSYGWLYRSSKAALNMAVVAAQADYPLARFILMHPGWVQTDMGGQRAPVTVVDSVAGMRQTVQQLPVESPAGSVPFVQYDGTAFQGW